MLPVPKYADVVLTPPASPPPAGALAARDERLLARLARGILDSGDVYSITASPLLCPANKHQLYTLKPYYWEQDGTWVQRDGERNPYCDLPKGQAILQQMAMAIRKLALGSRLPGMAEPCTARAEQILRVFFLDEHTRMESEIRFSQCIPDNLVGDRAFIVASLSSFVLSPVVTAGLRAWFQTQLHWIETSEQGEAARTYGNNISIWLHALVRSHLDFLKPGSGAANAYAAQTIAALRRAHPTSLALFARELVRTRPRHYVLFTLEPLFLLAGPRPSRGVREWLRAQVVFARGVEPGAIERDREGGGRYEARLAWFERLADWVDGKDVPAGEPDGSPWPEGWKQDSRLLWAVMQQPPRAV